jgi:hypothetical protein
MATIEELRLQEEIKSKNKELHKKWRKEFNWFAIIPRDPFWDGESGTFVIELSEFNEFLENIRSNDDKKKWKGEVEFVYKTNGWKEDLIELD